MGLHFNMERHLAQCTGSIMQACTPEAFLPLPVDAHHGTFGRCWLDLGAESKRIPKAQFSFTAALGTLAVELSYLNHNGKIKIIVTTKLPVFVIQCVLTYQYGVALSIRVHRFELWQDHAEAAWSVLGLLV